MNLQTSISPNAIEPGLLLASGSSTVSDAVDRLFISLTALSVLMLCALALGIGYFLIRYRKGSKADRAPPAYNSRRIEIAWVILTLLVFLAIGVWGSVVYLRIARPPDGDALELYVVGRQWMWEVQHPSGRREHNEIHMPVGQNVRLNLISEDVIHSLYLPAFRLKHDVMPRRFTTLWAQATETGKFDLYCAEFCGTEHHLMRGAVFVMQAQDYATWSEHGASDSDLAQRGAAHFSAYGCAGCHSPYSEIHAPDLEGLYGRQVPLANGGFVTADEAYLYDSIMLPNKHVVEGYESIMPTFQDVVKTSEAFALVEYIKSLAASSAPTKEVGQ